MPTTIPYKSIPLSCKLEIKKIVYIVCQEINHSTLIRCPP